MNHFKSLVNYYLREKQYNTAVLECDEEAKKGKDAYISYYRSIANFKQSRLLDAIRDIKAASLNKEFRFTAVSALIHYHQVSPTKDEQELSNLTQSLDKLKNEVKTLQPADLVNAMRFYYYVNDLDRFYDCSDLMENAKINSNDGEDLLVKGWNLCYSDNPEEINSGNEFFTKYLKEFGGGNIDAVMGGFKCLERLKMNEEVLDSFSAVNDYFKVFPPLLIEKTKIFLNLSDFDNAAEYIRNQIKFQHFEVTKILAVCNLVNEGNFKDAIDNINKTWKQIQQQEPSNPELYFETAKLFARICDRNKQILSVCEAMIDKSITFDIRNTNYLIEKGYYKQVQGDFKAAEKLYSEALSIDGNQLAKDRLLHIKILTGASDAGSELSSLKSSTTQSSDILYCELLYKSILFANTPQSRSEEALKIIEEKFSPMLSEILTVHVNHAKRFYFTKYDIIIATNYDFLCDIAKTGMDFFSVNSANIKIDQSNLPTILVKTKKILDSILKNKYFISAFLLNAKLKFLCKDKQGAMIALESIIKTDPTSYLDAYILAMMISNEQKTYSKTKELINDARLNVKEDVTRSIHFLLAKLNYEIAVGSPDKDKSLTLALNLIKEIEDNLVNRKHDPSIVKSNLFEYNSSDKFVLMRIQIEMLMKANRIKEAQELINQLVSENPMLGDDVILLNAEIACLDKNYTQALGLLKKIKPSSGEETYTHSRVKLADIYLTALVDRRLYSWCYQEILENFNSFDNLKLAAKAEISIDAPDRAILYYKEALKIKEEVELIRDLGKAFILIHDYSSARSYYEETLRNVADKLDEKNVYCYYEIVEDYTRMLKMLATDPKSNLDLLSVLDVFIVLLRKVLSKYSDIFLLKIKLATLLFFLGGVAKAVKQHLPTSNDDSSNSILSNPLLQNPISYYDEAVKLVKEVNLKTRDDESALRKQKAFIADIYYDKGVYHQIDGNFEGAEKAYQESLTHLTSEKALKALINTALHLKKLDVAQKHADMLIRLNENSEENISLLVTVISNRKSNEAASAYLEEIINKETSFKLVEVYIELVRRTGKINKVKELLTKAEKKYKFAYSPGLTYCKGLYYRYTNETNLALKEFSKIKTDEYYGVKCIEQMLELYLNPDNNILLLELPSPYKISVKDGIIDYSTSDINFQAVKFLLQELQVKKDDDMSKIYGCWVSLLVRDEKLIKSSIDQAKDIVAKDNDNISAWVFLAMSYLILDKDKEVKTALNVLENSKINNIKYYNDYERGYLILAFLFIKQGNNNKALEYLKKIVSELNIAQVKVYEMYGTIYEKENNYKEACNFFEKAWEFSSFNSASIGYKLAVCYLNNRNPIKAVNICNEVMKKFPEYPINDLAAKAKNYLA